MAAAATSATTRAQPPSRLTATGLMDHMDATACCVDAVEEASASFAQSAQWSAAFTRIALVAVAVTSQGAQEHHHSRHTREAKMQRADRSGRRRPSTRWAF